jgi:hypothetical protein
MKQCYILSLPIEMFDNICMILGKSQLLYCLYYSSKFFYHHVRYEICCYQIYPHQIYSHNSKIFGIVKDSSKQISLSFDASKNKEFCPKTESVDINRPVRKLSLRGFSYSTYPTIKVLTLLAMKTLSELYLTESTDLETLNDFPLNLVSLSLFSMKKLFDISQIKEMTRLKQVRFLLCEEVTDLSLIKNISIVEIFNCKKIVDYSSLGNQNQLRLTIGSKDDITFDIQQLKNLANVRELTLHIPKHSFNYDFSIFRKIQKLYLLNYHHLKNKSKFNMNEFNGTDLELNDFDLIPLSESNHQFQSNNLMSFRCHYCRNIPVSLFLHVKKLSFFESTFFMTSHNHENSKSAYFTDFLTCNLQKDFQTLRSPSVLHSLSISSCSTLIEVYPFGCIPYLHLSACPNLRSLDGLGNRNKKVRILFSDNIASFTPLNGIHNVSIRCCESFISGKGLENVSNISIEDCPLEDNVTYFSKARSVKLQNLSKITNLNGLKDVLYVIVDGCDSLHDISNLGGNEYVDIIECERICSDKYIVSDEYPEFKEKIPHLMILDKVKR